jgi:hypothetical protein
MSLIFQQGCMARGGHGMDSLKSHLDPPCPTILCPAGRPLLKRPFGGFWGGPPVRQAPCGRFLPLWTPNAIRLRCLRVDKSQPSVRPWPQPVLHATKQCRLVNFGTDTGPRACFVGCRGNPWPLNFNKVSLGLACSTCRS